MNSKNIGSLKSREKQFFWHGFLLGLIVGALIISFLLAIMGPINK